MSDRPRRSVFNTPATLISRYPLPVVVAGILVAGGCGFLAARDLLFQTSRNDLLSPELPWNQRFVDWLENFPGSNDLIIVVASDPEDETTRDRAISFIQDLVPALVADPDIEAVEWGAPTADYSPKTARLAPLVEFRRWVEDALRAENLLRSDSPGDMLGGIRSRLVKHRSFAEAGQEVSPETASADIDRLRELIGSVHDAFETPPQAEAAYARLLTDSTRRRWQYLETPNGRLIIVQASPRPRPETVNPSAAGITAARRAVAQVLQAHPGVEAGLTGVEVVDSDETEVATVDSSIASAVAFLLIAIVLTAAFHGLRLPLILMSALVLGVIWSFGFLTLTIGHLQILSVVFLVVLLGLGVDFGIHLTATYDHIRHEYPDGREHFQPALAETLRLTGPGIITGALTTAAAFLTTAFTDFKGVAEMGIIASGGVVLCLIAMFTVLPALLAMFRHSPRHVRPPRFHVFREQWLLPVVSRRPWVTLAVAAVAVGLAAYAATKVRFVYDLIALQPEGVESVTWQSRLNRDGGMSIYFGVSVTDDLEEARRRDARFKEKPTVSAVGGIGLIFPDDDREKAALAAEARQAIEPALAHARRDPAPAPDHQRATKLTTEMSRLDRLLAHAQGRDDVPAEIQQAIGRLRQQFAETLELIRSYAPSERGARAAAVDRGFVAMRQALAAHLQQLLDPTPLETTDLPGPIMRPYVDASDPDHPRYCLHVYAKLPDDPDITNPLSPDFLPDFVEDLTDVDPLVTGSVVQIQRSGHLIVNSYRTAGVAALIVVFMLVLIDFKSVYDTALALLPVVLSFTITFGVMVLVDMDLNPANLMVLPLLFGIGIDAGVHVMHRFRLNPGDRPIGLTYGTGKGITLTCLTTMIGFAAMMFARHRGVASLGFVLTVGIGTVTILCWTVLPAWLELRRRYRETKETT
jgi:hopanoid biosynthesis associated RND transporter like protein HpnN